MLAFFLHSCLSVHAGHTSERRSRARSDVNQQERWNIVTQINNIDGLSIVQTGKRLETSSGEGFQNTLDDALGKASESDTGSAPLSALSEPQALNFGQDVPTDMDIAGQTDSLLDLLEAYADGLENPDASLKDLSSLVDRIQEEARQLMTSTDENTTAGGQLKEIAAQTAMTANMEYIKFQRGDFL